MALTHFPEGLRPAVEAIFRIDATFAEVVAGTTEPQVGLIRLAWWREALERLIESGRHPLDLREQREKWGDHEPPPEVAEGCGGASGSAGVGTEAGAQPTNKRTASRLKVTIERVFMSLLLSVC